jgi:myo-inositol-1-phosphate synthase
MSKKMKVTVQATNGMRERFIVTSTLNTRVVAAGELIDSGRLDEIMLERQIDVLITSKRRPV